MSDTTSPYDDEVTDPYADDPDVKNPHEPGGDDDAPDDDDEADDAAEDPPKRRPGRPRKNPEA